MDFIAFVSLDNPVRYEHCAPTHDTTGPHSTTGTLCATTQTLGAALGQGFHGRGVELRFELMSPWAVFTVLHNPNEQGSMPGLGNLRVTNYTR